MHVDKVPLREESVDGLRRDGTDAEHGAEQVRAGTQVGLGAQVFHGVALFLHGIAGVAGADHLHLFGLDFKGLLRAGRQHQRAGDLDGAAQGGLDHIGKVAQVLFTHDLHGLKEGAVVEGNKGKRFAVAHRAHPAGHGHFRAVRGRLAEQRTD